MWSCVLPYIGWLFCSVVEGGPVWTSEYTEDVDTGRVPTFGFLIALFYPSVTGIMAGSNRYDSQQHN